MVSVNLVTTIGDRSSLNFLLIKLNKLCIELKLKRANIQMKQMLLNWVLDMLGLDSIESLNSIFIYNF